MILHLTAHCKDTCVVMVRDNDGNEVLDYVGYVPDYIPNFYNDDVELEIDPETGHILNWDARAVLKAIKASRRNGT